jgi:4-amino-4-deoxy-L-arabinose transferase-like glycosyltransferase
MPKTHRMALLVVLVVSLVIRLVIALQYGPLYRGSGDDVIYRQMALNLLDHGSFQSQGERPPLYPLLLAAVWRVSGSGNLVSILIMQMVLGVITALLWASAAGRLTADPRISLVVGLVATLDLPRITLELRLLTEPLATVLIALIVWMLVRMLRGPLQPQAWLALGMGISLAALTLTRVVFAVFVAVPLLCLVVGYWGSAIPFRRRLTLSGGVLLPPILALVGLLLINQRLTGYVTLSTNSGYNLSNTICNVMDVAPDTYADIRDAYVAARAEQYAQTGTCSQTIWTAAPQIMAQTGETFPHLSNRLTLVWRSVVQREPAAYLRTVFLGSLLAIFDEPVFVEGMIWRLVFPLLHYLAVLAGFISLGTLWVRMPTWPRPIRRHRQAVLLFCVAGIAYIVVASATVEYGENGRYRYPLNMLLYTPIVLALMGSAPADASPATAPSDGATT